MGLRWYQSEAVDSALKYLETEKGHPLVVLPTGSGKTHVLGELCKKLTESNPGVKILIVSHIKEILTQNYKQLKKFVDPDCIGMYSSGLKLFERKKYTIAGIQTVYKFGNLFKEYSYIIVDEAHLIPAKGEGRYKTFFKNMQHAKIIGLTATPFRLGHGYLTDNHLFDKIVYEADIVKLIKEGYLTKLITKEPSFEMPVEKLKVIAGDYSKKSLSEELDRNEITRQILQELLKYKSVRKKWLIFAIDIDHAEHINTLLCEMGIRSAAIHSKLDFDRTVLTDLYKEGYLQALVSVETLTTGFDVPSVDLVALMRPTQSPVLHVQMIGRGMRVCEDKDSCLVLDFAGNTKRLGPINAVYVAIKEAGKGKKGPGFTKTCPDCKEIVHTTVKECPACGHTFKFKQNLAVKADTIDIVKTNTIKLPTRFAVNNVRYHKHVKIGGSVSLKVSYICGLRVFLEWIGFEHKGYPRTRAESWWKYRAGTKPPDTVQEALQRLGELHAPEAIYVSENGKFPEVVRYEFTFGK